MSDIRRPTNPTTWDVLARADVLSGLLFIAIAAFGLWISRDYPVGTSLRMGTGYVPRLLCWVLLGLGAIVMAQGLRQPAPPLRSTALAWRAVLSVTIAIVLLVGIGALATRALRPLETAIAAVALIALSWAIFIAGLGLAIPMWPDL